MKTSNRWSNDKLRLPRRVKRLLIRAVRRQSLAPREVRDLARFRRKATTVELFGVE